MQNSAERVPDADNLLMIVFFDFLAKFCGKKFPAVGDGKFRVMRMTFDVIDFVIVRKISKKLTIRAGGKTVGVRKMNDLLSLNSIYHFPVTDINPAPQLIADFPKMRHLSKAQSFVKTHAGIIWQRNSGDDSVNIGFCQFIE